MSFASDVKKELIEKMPGGHHCRLAELSGMFLLGARVEEDSEGAIFLSFSSENEPMVKKCFTFLKKSFNMEAVVEDILEGDRRRHLYCLTISEGKQIDNVLSNLGLQVDASGQLTLRRSEHLLKRPCCKRSWIRALFTMAGTMTDPVKSYHFEIAMPTRRLAELLIEAMGEFGCEPKLMERRQAFAVYLKDGSQIADALKVMEAHVSLLEFENERVVREMRGRVNRQVNCEVSNLNKTTAAAKKQVESIALVRDTMGLENLPGELEKMARLRLQYPESSLKELGELMSPPMGRSGVNHRLQKLCDIAEGLRNRESD